MILCSDIMTEIQPAIIISIIAIIISGITSISSFYFIHLEPPKLVVEYLTKRFKELVFYEHIISVVNKGGKTAIIKELTTVPNSQTEIERYKITVTSEDKAWNLSEPDPFAVIPVNPKKNVVIFYTVSEKPAEKLKSDYWFELTFNKPINEKNVENKTPDKIKINFK